MKIIFKIAKAELRTFIYSPIAWAVSTAFLLVASLRLMFVLTFTVNQQDFNLETMKGWSEWDQPLSAANYLHISEPLIKLLYLFIPLLTMGLMNREVNSGTIKLLNSSPIKSREIVLGKFTGIMAFLSVFAMIIALLTLMLGISIKSFDYGMFLPLILGFYLLAGAYASIGLFISCLTSYQIVAGVLTFAVFIILHTIGGLWQQYDFIRDLTYFLSLNGRAEELMGGLLSTRDLMYFLLIIVMFLTFSTIKLKTVKEAAGGKLSFVRYSAVFIIVLMLGYLTSRPGYIGYVDFTQGQYNTLHPATREVVEKMGAEPLKVTLYTNLLGTSAASGFPQSRNTYIWQFWQKYQRFHPNIEFEYVYYYDLMGSDTALYRSRYPNKNLEEIAEDAIIAAGLPISLFKTPSEIRSLIDLEAEGKQLVMQLEFKGKKAFLRTYPSTYPWPDEKHVSGTISRLVNDTVPLILYSSGHFERSPYKNGMREFSGSTLFKLQRDALINLGVDIDTVNLAVQDIPASTDILVIADPKSALSIREKEKITAYLEAGGNCIFYGEPGKQEMLNPILHAIGIQLDNGTIVNANPHEMPHILISKITSAGTHMAGEYPLYYNQMYPSKEVFLQLAGTTAITSLRTSDFKIEPIFNTTGDDTYWIENGTLVVDSAAPKFSESEGDIRKAEYVTGVKLTRTINNKEQRIVVMGDADFMSNERQNGQSFSNAASSWGLYNAFPKYTNRTIPMDNLYLINGATADILFNFIIYILPAIIIISGTVILIRRGRK